MFQIGDIVTIGDELGIVIETFEYHCSVVWISMNNYKSPHGYKMLVKVS